MEFDRKTILAFLLIGLILIFLQTDWYQKNFLPRPAPQAIEGVPIDIPTETADRPEGERTEQAEIGQSAAGEPGGYVAQRGTGEEVVVETDLYRATFSTQGATLRTWTLKNYVRTDSTLVQLVGRDGQGNLGLILPTKQDTLDTAPFVFSVNKKSIRLTPKRATDKLVFSLPIGDGQEITKSFTFYRGKYDIQMDVDFRNLEDVVEGFSYFVRWNTGLASTEPDLADDMASARAYAWQGDAEAFDVTDKSSSSDWDNPTNWVALKTKYFTLAVIPQTSDAQGVIFHGEEVDVGDEARLKRFGFDLQMPLPNGQPSTVGSYIVYLGPLDYDIITAYNVELEKIMDLGWAIFRPFGRAILWSFDLLHSFISNYGVIIIVFSILIKVLLYPLTKKSFQSMRQMQTLQPMMQEINEKYKSDPQKKQQEMMKLYKEYGFNPLSGCVPMLLQMPLLIALFQVFRSTIQLRQSPFVGWISDLSRPDTIAHLPFGIPLYGDTVNVLPIFMGVTMFVQQKMTMKDPKQKAMVYLMPVFFTLLFNSFPSGLNLYYAMFNLLSILQEKLIPHPPPKSVEELKTQRRKKRRRVKHDYKGGFYK
ncbi:membrane protein insertase YidC [bacterium]|nr:membrane protein insertase YidC [bacterium]